MSTRKELAVERRARTRCMKNARGSTTKRGKAFWVGEARSFNREIVRLKRMLK